jgi:hypothetical protein
MAEHVPHEDDEDWVVIALPEGILSARDHISITQAASVLRSRVRARGANRPGREQTGTARPARIER